MKRKEFSNSRFFKLLDKVVTSSGFLKIVLGLLWFLKCTRHPERPISFLGFLPSIGIIRCIAFLIYAYFTFSFAMIMSFIFAHITSSLPMYLMIMYIELRPGLPENKYLMERHVRTAQFLFPFYRQFEIILKALMEVYAMLLMPIETILTMTVIASNCCLILYRSELNTIQLLSIINALVLGWTSLVVTFEISGRFEMYSRRTYMKWKKWDWGSRRREKAIVGKFIKSCKPLRIGYKGFRRITRVTLLQIGRSIGVNTFRIGTTIRKFYEKMKKY